MCNIIKTLCFFILLMSGCLESYAIYAKPGLIEAEQPDGKKIKIYLQGDENCKLALSSDSLLLIPDNEGYYVIADLDKSGNPVPTNIRELNPANRSNDAKATISRINQKKLRDAMTRFSENESYSNPRFLPGLFDIRFPAWGEPRSLVILVEFSDNEFTIENPNDFYTRMMNEEGFSDNGATGSARDYFIANSGGLFKPQFDVYGPVKLSRNISYYGANNLWGNDVRPQLVPIEACTLLDDEVDFSIYDTDKDGVIDNVYIFYAGYGEADGGGSGTIWPHSWDITKASVTQYTFDGVLLDHYACSNELQKVDDFPDGIGTFCHEFGHVLGLPDLYATAYNRAFTPYIWDIMDTGSYNNRSMTPPNYSSFERCALGWMDPIVLTCGDNELVHLGDSNQAYLVPTDDETEYYLLENRQQVGYDEYLPGHGMLIWHIDYNYKKWSDNTVNNTVNHQNIDLIEADNLLTRETLEGDPFPGSENVTEFSCQTTPAFISWRSGNMPFRIYDIKEREDGVITFSVEDCEFASVRELEQKKLIRVEGNRMISTLPLNLYDYRGILVGEEVYEIELPAGIYIAVGAGVSEKFVVK